jgi:hypothetical protein
MNMKISELSKRHETMFALAKLEAMNSEMANHVGCVASSNGDCVASACNSYRSRVRKQNVCSLHAEVATISGLVRGTRQSKWREKVNYCLQGV